MVMQSVSLPDTLTIKESSSSGIKFKTSSNGITAAPQDNLVYKAAALFLSVYPQKQGVEITLEKKIPIAAGLAGGSADCAGTLIGLNALFKVKAPLQELTKMANTLGSDIAFCLQGGTALAEGRGEKITLLPPIKTWYGLVLKPPFSISTAAVYSAIPKGFVGKRDDYPVTLFTQGKITLENIAAYLKNDLFVYARSIRPELETYMKYVQKTNPRAYQMSGSGSSIFAFYQDSATRDAALLALEKEEVYPIETVPRGISLKLKD
jgi:4-diphosphocytidyl-2-C-methyl-D-erythritol kinase